MIQQPPSPATSCELSEVYKLARAADIAYKLTQQDLQEGRAMIAKGLTALEAAFGLLGEQHDGEHLHKPRVVLMVADRLRDAVQQHSPDLAVESIAATLTVQATRGHLEWAALQVESGRSAASCAFDLLGDLEELEDRVRARAVEQTRELINLRVQRNQQRRPRSPR